MSRRGIIVYAVLILLLIPFGYALWGELWELQLKQESQAAFQERVEQMSGEPAGPAEWRWKQKRSSSPGNTMTGKGDSIARMLREVGFVRGSLPREAPGFTLRDLDGNRRSLSDWRGKWVLLNFWTTWCRACRQEMPSMQRLWDQWKDRDLIVVGINVQETRSVVEPFVSSLDLTFPVLLDSQGKTATAYRVTGIPETILIDPQGNTMGKVIGYRNWDENPVHALLKSLQSKNEDVSP